MIHEIFQFVTYLTWALLLFSIGLSYLGIKKMIKEEEQGKEIIPLILLVVSVCYLLAYYL